MRQIVCDNENCSKEATIERYGELLDETQPNWYTVARLAKEYERPLTDDKFETIEVNEREEYEFCSKACIVEQMRLELRSL